MAFLGRRRSTHAVIGGPTELAGVCPALRAAGIAHACAQPEQVRHLEPLEPCGLHGWVLHFDDGRVESVGGVILGAQPSQMPWLDPGIFDWESGRPALVAGLLAPGLANLYVLGLGTACFRAGGTELAVAMIRAQAERAHPLVDELMSIARPSYEWPVGRGAHRLERRLHRHLDHGGAAWWWGVRELDGPLAAARAS